MQEIVKPIPMFKTKSTQFHKNYFFIFSVIFFFLVHSNTLEACQQPEKFMALIYLLSIQKSLETLLYSFFFSKVIKIENHDKFWVETYWKFKKIT